MRRCGSSSSSGKSPNNGGGNSPLRRRPSLLKSADPFRIRPGTTLSKRPIETESESSYDGDTQRKLTTGKQYKLSNTRPQVQEGEQMIDRMRKAIKIQELLNHSKIPVKRVNKKKTGLTV
jgi:hypothetical protein